MAFPNVGQSMAGSRTADLGVRRAPSRIGQTPTQALNARVPRRPNLLGGGGMAAGMPRQSAKQALLSGLKG